MIEIKKEFVKTAERETEMMMDELSEMAKIATSDDFNKIAEVCEICDITEDELDAIIEGDVDDMSLYDYNCLKSYFKHMIKFYDAPIEGPDILDEDAKKCAWCGIDKCAQCNGCKNEECDNYNCTCKDKTYSKFIDDVNANLPDKWKIDKEDAMKAKKAFGEDIQKAVENNTNKAAKAYDKAAKQANMELFGTEKDLNSLTIAQLKYFIYKNRWDKEFDINTINNRQTVLSFLYHKLEDRVSEIIHQENNIKKEDIDNINKTKEEFDKNTKHNYGNEAVNSVFNMLDELQKIFNKNA